MKRTGNIALISFYELGHQPAGLTGTVAHLVANGFSPEVHDLSVETISAAELSHVRLLYVWAPMHTAVRLALTWLPSFRALCPSVPVCFFGIYAELNAEYLLDTWADFIVSGEYEEGVVELANALESGLEHADLKYVSRRGQSRSPRLARTKYIVNDRSLLPPLSEYARLLDSSSRKLTGYVEATRGCLHLCAHCPIPPIYGGRFFAFDREKILDDIDQLTALGAEHITFGDPDFLNGPTHATRLIAELAIRHPNISFDFTAKVEHLLRHAKLLPFFVERGCAFVTSAFESIDDSVLRYFVKGHTRDDIVTLLRLADKHGLVLRPTFIPFHPWTTPDSFADLLSFVSQHGLIERVDPVQFVVKLLVPPRSLMLLEPAIQTQIGALDPKELTYAWKFVDASTNELFESVVSIVDDFANDHSESDTIETFLALCRCVESFTSKPTVLPHSVVRLQKQQPRLSENWFCCAEPSSLQRASVGASIQINSNLAP